jgi:hypothetical protein
MFSSLSKPFTMAWLSVSEWYLLLFGVVLVVGLVGEFLADHKGKKYSRLKKRKRLFEILVISGVAGELLADGGIFLFGGHLQSFAEIEVASLNKDAASARLETTQLKLQITRLTNNVEHLDMRKWPVHSLTAEVKLLLKPQQELAGDLNFPAHLEISQSGKNRLKVLLACNGAIDLGFENIAPTYCMMFSSPFRPIGLAISPIEVIHGESAIEASSSFDTMSLIITNFPAGNAEIIRASAIVTINEIIRTRFFFNPIQLQNGFGILKGSLATNSITILKPE